MMIMVMTQWKKLSKLVQVQDGNEAWMQAKDGNERVVPFRVDVVVFAFFVVDLP